MSRFVLDCNVWIALFMQHRELDLIELISKKRITVYYSETLLKEFSDVHSKYPKLKKKLPFPITDYLSVITDSCEYFNAESRVMLLMDYKDNYLIDLAHQTLSILVTNDKGFDIFKKFKTPPIEIIKAGEFYRLLNLK